MRGLALVLGTVGALVAAGVVKKGSFSVGRKPYPKALRCPKCGGPPSNAFEMIGARRGIEGFDAKKRWLTLDDSVEHEYDISTDPNLVCPEHGEYAIPKGWTVKYGSW